MENLILKENYVKVQKILVHHQIWNPCQKNSNDSLTMRKTDYNSKTVKIRCTI